MREQRRDDLSSKLVHLAQGEGDEAFKTLCSILNEKKIRATSEYRMDDIKTVCFSETPINKLARVMADSRKNKRDFKYAPFGIMVNKKLVFERDGRPVIYQKKEEYDNLPKCLQYRHVTYDISGNEDKDFTWEREWRLKTDEFVLDPKETTVILPTRVYEDKLLEGYFQDIQNCVDSEINHSVLTKVPCMGLNIDKYPWHFIVLEDLGMPMDF